MISLYTKALESSRKMEVLLIQANELIATRMETGGVVEDTQMEDTPAEVQRDMSIDEMEDVQESLQDEEMVSKSRRSTNSSIQSNTSQALAPGMQVAVRPEVDFLIDKAGTRLDTRDCD
jgi:hypothetical protein